ncbi:MAG: c-type cytochrome [Gemmataceae bacterium]|nr:c-type cytochrome [Gemmataceae bacterium]
MKRASALFVLVAFGMAGWLSQGDAPGQDKKAKPVIPHAQDRPPGPALSPAEAIRKMTVPEGFAVDLIVAEPKIVNPVAMAIDDRGRFWITESVEYPKRAAGPGKDVVKVVESTKGDGVYDKVTTVIEGLNIPSGVAIGFGGVWLANSPDILFYPFEDETNLKLGKPQVIVSGFGRDDTHELPNSLTWGPDGWLYGLNGVFNRSKVKHDGKVFDFTCALFRIHPKTKKFELFCEGTSNPWGVTVDGQGSFFISACVIDHLWHLVQSGYYHRQGGPYPPFTWKIESIVKHKHQKAAYCGITWYDADAYPEEYRGKLFMGNIHGNCINSDGLTRDGSSYFGKLRPDFLSANDAWFMPVVQKVGPDGCLYVLDWYDRYHCYQDANRDPAGIDRLYGRLYRVSYKGTKKPGAFDLKKETDAKLIELLGDANIFYRERAQRILAERSFERALMPMRATPDTVIKLQKLALDGNASRTARLHALWTCMSGEAYDPRFHLDVLHDQDATIRAFGVRYASNRGEVSADVAKRIVALAHDASPDVQLQVAIAATRVKGLDAIPLLIDVLANAGHDKLIPHIVWQNLHPLLETQGDLYLRLVGQRDLDAAPNLARLMPRVVDRILASRSMNPKALAEVLVVLAGQKGDRESAANLLASIATKIQTGELKQPQVGQLAEALTPTLAKLQNGPNVFLAMEATFLAVTLEQKPAIDEARKILVTSDRGDGHRLKALSALASIGDFGAIDAVGVILVDPKLGSSNLRGQLLNTLGKFDHPKVADALIAAYAKLEPDMQPKAIEVLTQRPGWSKALLGEIASKKIPQTALNINQVRKLIGSKDQDLVKQVAKVWGTIRDGRNPAREKVVAEMRELLKSKAGDPHQGALHFKKLCAQCHKLHGEGQEVGPDLTGNGRSDFEQLLSNVFDPSLVIGAGYHGVTVANVNGQVLTGLIVEDSPQRVVLKTQGGKIETIARDNVEQLLVSKVSYMPEDVEKQLRPQEIIDLFAYITLDKPPTDPTARRIPGTPMIK